MLMRYYIFLSIIMVFFIFSFSSLAFAEPPSKVENLSYFINPSGLMVVDWLEPLTLGSSDDIIYNIIISDVYGDIVNVIDTSSTTYNMRGFDYDLSQYYEIEVIAVNGDNLISSDVIIINEDNIPSLQNNVVTLNEINEVDISFDNFTNLITVEWDFGDSNPVWQSCNLKTDVEFALNEKKNKVSFNGVNYDSIENGSISIIVSRNNILSEVSCKGSLIFDLDYFGINYDEFAVYSSFFNVVKSEYLDTYDDRLWRDSDYIQIAEAQYQYWSDDPSWEESCLWYDDAYAHLKPKLNSYDNVEFEKTLIVTNVYGLENSLSLTKEGCIEEIKNALANIDTETINTETINTETIKKSGGGDGNKHLTAPSFGMSLSNPNQKFVEGGYGHNDLPFDITDNWHTDFERIEINVDEPINIKIKGIFPNGMKGIGWMLVPEVGASDKAEVEIITYTNYSDEIEGIETYQGEHKIIDFDKIEYNYYTESCGFVNSVCHVVEMNNIIFLEKPFSEVIGLYAVDNQRRSTITYLNEGYGVNGESLNDPLTIFAHGKLFSEKDKFLKIWYDEEGVDYEKNDYDSFKRLTPHDPILCDDKALDEINVWQRLNCNYPDYIDEQKIEALKILKITCPTCLESAFFDFKDSFSYDINEKINKLDNPETLKNMKAEEIKALVILKKIMSPSDVS